MLVLNDEFTEAEKLAYLDPLVTGPYNQYPDGKIDCTFDIPDYGPNPFTADPADEYEHCRLIHRICSERIEGGAEHTTEGYNVLPPAAPAPAPAAVKTDPRDTKIAELEARLAALEGRLQ